MNDTDFEQFIKLLDAALVSDDKKIKTALRKFMFIMALNLSDDDCEPGPFTKMMETIDELQRRVGGLERKDNSTRVSTDLYTTQTWPYGVGIGTGTAAPYQTPPPSTTGGSVTATGTTQWTNAPSASTGTVTTTTANTLLGRTNCWTNTGTYNLFFDDEDTGTEIKNEIKEKLTKLVNAK